MVRKKLLAAILAVVLMAGGLSFVMYPHMRVAAAPAPVTYGDIQAILRAGFTGGQDAILVHATQALGAPVEDYSRATIDFFTPNVPHFCVDDWHLLRLFSANSVDGVVFVTREQAITDLQQQTLTFTMDGAPVSAIQTPITQLSVADQQLFGLPGPTFFYQEGSIFSPGALSVGSHVARFTITDPVFGRFHTFEPFVVDPSGTGACLQA